MVPSSAACSERTPLPTLHQSKPLNIVLNAVPKGVIAETDGQATDGMGRLSDRRS